MQAINPQETTRSEEVQEILGTPPAWLVRWGSLLLLIVFTTLGWLAYVVRYPDMVKDELRLSSYNPPRRLVADRSTIITHMLVGNDSEVAQGDPLLVYSANGNYQDVLRLDSILREAELRNTDPAQLSLPRDLNLGEIQPALFALLERQDALRNVRSGADDRSSIGQLEARIRQQQNNLTAESNQLATLRSELSLAQQRLLREENLLSSQLSTPDKVRERREDVLRTERLIQGSETAIDNTEFEIRMMRNQISSYRSGTAINATRTAVDLREQLTNLRVAITSWKSANMLLAPIAGRVIVPSEIAPRQQVRAGRELVILVPNNTEGIVGRVELNAQQKAGKIQPGQRVVVDFASYPSSEYGSVIGRVSSKSAVPIDGKILVDIAFPNGLTTTAGRQLEATDNMEGQVTIITEERRLVEWLFRRF